MADVPTMGAPTAIATNHHPFTRGWMPPLVGPCHWPGESLLRADAHLGLLLCCDADFPLLIGVGLRVLCVRWPLNYMRSFSLGGESWIAERVLSSCGKKDLPPLHALGETCNERDASL
jgi:hypothetical protein